MQLFQEARMGRERTPADGWGWKDKFCRAPRKPHADGWGWKTKKKRPAQPTEEEAGTGRRALPYKEGRGNF